MDTERWLWVVVMKIVIAKTFVVIMTCWALSQGLYVKDLTQFSQ